MKHVMIVAATLLAATGASAQTTGMEGAYGNTIVTTMPDGTGGKTYVDPDGTYKAVNGTTTSTGKWSVKKGLVCYSQMQPAVAAPLCTMGARKKVGDKWKIFQGDGQAIRVEMVAGR